MMKNTYVAGVVDCFHSTADMNYVCEFMLDVMEDPRYNQNSPDHYDHIFQLNMMQFIYGNGQ